MAHALVAQGLSQRRACQVAGLARGSYGGGGQEANRAVADGPVREELQALVERHRGWGFWKDHHRLRKNGELVNHKRLWRLYQALGLPLGKHRKKCRLPDRLRQPLLVPAGPNGGWSLDFISATLTDGRRFRTRNVIDDFNRQVLGIEEAFSLPATRVVRLLAQLVEQHGRPEKLRCDNGSEFISATLGDWCEAQGIVLHWIRPDKPTQNAYVARFNGSFRREGLEAYRFTTMRQVRHLLTERMHDDNTRRPHQAPGFYPDGIQTSGLTPDLTGSLNGEDYSSDLLRMQERGFSCFRKCRF